MASMCRFAAVISRRAVRSVSISRIEIPVSKSAPPPALFFSSGEFPLANSRFAYVMGSLETMLPLYSAIASCRLKSNIAMDATCWSWLSRDFAVPR